MAQISWQHQKILWVYGLQSGLTLLFRKWHFWRFRQRHPLGLCHGVSICRTSTMIYSRTLFLLIVEKKNLDWNWSPIPSLHKITLVNNLLHSVSMISITFFRQLIDVILLWSGFSVTTTTLLFLISLVAPLKQQDDVKNQKLWSPK